MRLSTRYPNNTIVLIVYFAEVKMFEQANRIVPWIIATGIWANFALSLHGRIHSEAMNAEFSRALQAATAIRSDVGALQGDLSNLRYLTCVRNRLCPRWP